MVYIVHAPGNVMHTFLVGDMDALIRKHEGLEEAIRCGEDVLDGNDNLSEQQVKEVFVHTVLSHMRREMAPARRKSERIRKQTNK